MRVENLQPQMSQSPRWSWLDVSVKHKVWLHCLDIVDLHIIRPEIEKKKSWRYVSIAAQLENDEANLLYAGKSPP